MNAPMTNAQRGSRVVFVGNIPYDMSEEQLVEVFREVGKVVGFRLVNDRDTGKFKGYGFCEFEDPETAASAVRNLNDVEVGGRPLRIDFADIDPLMEGRTTQHGQFDQDDLRRRAALAGRAGRPGTFGHSLTIPGWTPRPGMAGGAFGPPGSLPSNLPAGVPLPPGVGATDAITQTLATLPPNQLLDIMSHMKALVATSPDQARALLNAHPQLAYALFQAMLLMNVVDPAILQQILAASATGASGPEDVTFSQPATHSNTPPPHPAAMGRPAPAAYDYGQPPQPPTGPAATRVSAAPPPPAAPSASQATGGGAALAGQNLGEEQRQLLMQVLQLTPEQINALPPDQKASILQLKAQFGQA